MKPTTTTGGQRLQTRLRISEVCKMWGISRTKFWRMRNDGELAHILLGGIKVFDPDDIRQYERTHKISVRRKADPVRAHKVARRTPAKAIKRA